MGRSQSLPTLLSFCLGGVAFFDFFATQKDAPEKGEVPTASYGQLKVLNGLRKWDKAEERWTQYLGVLSWWDRWDPDDADSRAVRGEMASRSELGRRKTALESWLDAETGKAPPSGEKWGAAGQHRCELELGSAAAVARVGLQVPVQDGLPGTTLVSCELQPDLTKFNVLTRSLACDPLRLVERPLQDGTDEFINDFASKLLCAKVSSDLSQNLAQASQELRRLASPFFTPAEVLPLPPSAQEALDLRQIWWKGPMGHVLRSFLNEASRPSKGTSRPVDPFVNRFMGWGSIAHRH
eukprot:g9986.t1